MGISTSFQNSIPFLHLLIHSFILFLSLGLHIKTFLDTHGAEFVLALDASFLLPLPHSALLEFIHSSVLKFDL